MQHQDSPLYIDEVTVSDRSLPSYRETRRYRYHAYGRPISVLVNETDEDGLLNTIYDDERVILSVPPSPTRRVATYPLLPRSIDEFKERLRRNKERAIAFESRLQRLSTVIVEFVAGFTRGTRG